LKTHSKEWAKWITEESSFLIDLPKDLESKVSTFQKLLLIKIMKVEKTLKGMDLYIEK
jgi:predicted sulfurtransferase